MLSKAEVMYLQGQKEVSASYERKLKYLIRKKAEGLKSGLPLLFKIFPIADLFDYDDEDVKDESIHNPFVAYNANNPSKFSNSKIKNNETVTGCATDFRNTAVMKKKASTQEK